jgi:putative tryptophan/tyrosine transport system substrate-binding protein
MRRREFLTVLGGATAASPLRVNAQEAKLPTIGFVNSGSRQSWVHAAFHRGLAEAGFVEGQNLRVEYRWAEGEYDRLPALVEDLIRREVAVLVAFGGVHTAVAAKGATATVPIVFANGSDPVKFGLVASLNRPGGNLTGVSFLTNQLEAKRLGLLHELVPHASTIAVLVNPANANAEKTSRELKEAAGTLRLQVHVIDASSDDAFAPAFAKIAQISADALLVASDPLFFVERKRLVSLVAGIALPAMFDWREFVEAGGLASYGTSLSDAFRQAGVYAGRILKGAKPNDLPVLQATKFEFVVNLKTAKTLGLTLPLALLGRADEVIE